MDYSAANINRIKDEFRDKKTKDGRRGPFYNGQQAWLFDARNEDLFKNAVWQGYLDASRTFLGIKHTESEHRAFDKLAQSIQGYFKGKEDFDHDGWCESFLVDISRYNKYDARYGQVQKVVNMAFKYLYCCEGAEDYPDMFEPCHMPLDQYTLAWLFSAGGKYYLEWSYFDKERYKEAQNEIKGILKDNVLGKELVIWEDIQKRYVNLKKPKPDVSK